MICSISKFTSSAQAFEKVLFNVDQLYMDLCLVTSLCFTSQGGIYVFLMFDYYMGSRVLLAVCFTELVLVAYVYGTSSL